MSNENKFDVVIYGATGFTGKLIAEYMVSQYGHNQDVTWAMAGRNLEKLEQVRDEIKANHDTPLLVVNSEDRSSLDSMAAQTKCVLTTVGPYQLYGSDLVAACAEGGTDYVDLTGEPGWMYEMIQQNEESAKKTGSRIVFSCGFDSIPFDLGVLYVQDAAKEKFGKPAPHVRGRVRAMHGEFSGGTVASLTATMSTLREKPELIKVLANPFSLSGNFKGPEQLDDSRALFDEKLEMWIAPFIMASINTKNIHRSNALMGHAYGEDFRYDEMSIAGSGDEGKARAEFMATLNPLVGDDMPAPGEGPSKESRENGNFNVLFCADMPNGETLNATVTGDMDPGYGSTSKMIAESAVCLVKDCLELEGGIYTPAPSMGKKLITRLVANAGLTFSLD
ncbi:MAG: saccharopine dehydrogenase NADP-binding domain-containing protein [SAR86 cluster bacterium]|jgi:short subunit dehydrogenase-like uncharacterized protein|nr:saccharopine dehydrogenase NADP-binding domain-containing protein [SAR86 cluster bacterium]